MLTTMPKTGTYLLTPLLEKLSGHAQLWSPDHFLTETPIEDQATWHEALQDVDLVPVYLHHELVCKDIFALEILRKWEEGSFFASHCPYSKNLDDVLIQSGVKVFHMVRDPRDYCVSGAFFYGKGDACLFPKEWYQALPFDLQLLVMIHGLKWYNGCRWFLDVFAGWHTSPNCCVVSYEKLLGLSQGFYRYEEQIAELRKIASHIQCDLSDEQLLAYFQEAYGQGPTFRKGKTKNWSQYFKLLHKEAAKKHFQEYLVRYSYEAGDDW